MILKDRMVAAEDEVNEDEEEPEDRAEPGDRLQPEAGRRAALPELLPAGPPQRADLPGRRRRLPAVQLTRRGRAVRLSRTIARDHRPDGVRADRARQLIREQWPKCVDKQLAQNRQAVINRIQLAQLAGRLAAGATGARRRTQRRRRASPAVRRAARAGRGAATGPRAERRVARRTVDAVRAQAERRDRGALPRTPADLGLREPRGDPRRARSDAAPDELEQVRVVRAGDRARGPARQDRAAARRRT
jgi:hypothetical protein